MVANRFVTVASVPVRVSITPVVKCPRTEKRLVDVAFVVEALVAKKLVVVEFVSEALARVVEPAVSEPSVVAPETESEFAEIPVALTDAPVMVPPVIEAFEIATPLSWSILFVCAVTA